MLHANNMPVKRSAHRSKFPGRSPFLQPPNATPLQVLFAVSGLGVPDLLRAAGRPLTAAEVAMALGPKVRAEEAALESVLCADFCSTRVGD
jgi:hypothetical protein